MYPMLFTKKIITFSLGWSNPDKKKPTMEINPITKSDCKDASITVNVS